VHGLEYFEFYDHMFFCLFSFPASLVFPVRSRARTWNCTAGHGFPSFVRLRQKLIYQFPCGRFNTSQEEQL
jgi:hypothetical protein